jgi:hypothetical protein
MVGGPHQQEMTLEEILSDENVLRQVKSDFKKDIASILKVKED